MPYDTVYIYQLTHSLTHKGTQISADDRGHPMNSKVISVRVVIKLPNTAIHHIP